MTESVRLLSRPLARDLVPVLGEAAGAARHVVGANLGLATGAGAVATAVLTAGAALRAYVETANHAASQQAALNLAVRGLDAGPIRQQMTEASRTLEEFTVRQSTLVGRVQNLFHGLAERLGLAPSASEDLARAARALPRVLGFEQEQKLTDIKKRELDVTRSLLDLETERAGDVSLDALIRAQEKVYANLTRQLDAEEKLLQLTRDKAIAEATARGAPAEEIAAIRAQFNRELDVLAQSFRQRFQALQTAGTRARADFFIRAFPAEPGLEDAARHEGLAPGIAPGVEEMARARQGIAGADTREFLKPRQPLIELDNALKKVRAEAQVFGADFDAAGAAVSAFGTAIIDLKLQALDQSGEALEATTAKIAALQEQLDRFKRVEELQGTFRETFAALSSSASSAVADLSAGTATIEQAFGKMGQSILVAVQQVIIGRAFKALERALDELLQSQLIQQLIQAGLSALGSVFGVTTGPEQLSGPGSGYAPPGAAGGAVVRARPGGTLMWVGEGGKDEAIVPLDRGMPDTGDWGGGHSGPLVEVNVNVEPGMQVEQRQRTGLDGRQIRDFFVRGVRDAMGSGALDGDFKQFGVTRRGVTR